MCWFLCQCWWGFGWVSAFARTWVNLLVQPKLLNIHFTFSKPRGISLVLLPAGPQLGDLQLDMFFKSSLRLCQGEGAKPNVPLQPIEIVPVLLPSCKWWICLESPSRFCREIVFVVTFPLPLGFGFFSFFPISSFTPLIFTSTVLVREQQKTQVHLEMKEFLAGLVWSSALHFWPHVEHS